MRLILRQQLPHPGEDVQAWIPEEQVRDLFPAKKHYNYIVTI